MKVMGQSLSSAARKVSRSVSSVFSSSPDEIDNKDVGRFAITPFIFKRTGSMFFDEDGDLAHEFYEEVCEGCKYVMRRSWANLTPQGEIDLPHPRINKDFPTVICQAPYS